MLAGGTSGVSLDSGRLRFQWESEKEPSVMSLQKGKHSSAGQIPPQQRPQYPAAPAYGAPPPAAYQQYILSNRTPQDTQRVGKFLSRHFAAPPPLICPGQRPALGAGRAPEIVQPWPYNAL